MTEDINFFSPMAIEQLRRDHHALRLEVLELRRMVRALSAGDSFAPIVFGKTDGSGISALAGDTPGSGTVELYRKPAGESDFTGTNKDVTCLSSAGAVDANEYVAMIRDEFGRYWVIVENC